MIHKLDQFGIKFYSVVLNDIYENYLEKNLFGFHHFLKHLSPSSYLGALPCNLYLWL